MGDSHGQAVPREKHKQKDAEVISVFLGYDQLKLMKRWKGFPKQG